MEKVYELPLGSLATNCYIIPSGDRAVVIDPASSSEVLVLLEGMGLTLGAIVVTHGHFDHFAGAMELKRQTGAKIYGSRIDADMMSSAAKSWADFMPELRFEPTPPDEVFSDGDTLSLCGLDFKVMGTPGHTAGSCMLLLGSVIFAGDTLFQGSAGRTDGYSGSSSEQSRTMKKIAALDGDYTIYCGHGEHTTLEIEKKYNWYLRGEIYSNQ